MSRDVVSLAHLGTKARAQANAQLTAKRIISSQAKALEPTEKKSKYGAKRVEIDGIKFDSHAEGRRYNELKLLQRARKISDLECHPKYSLDVNGVHVGYYTADFSYGTPRGAVVEDVKSGPTMTTAARLRIKLFEACYPTCRVVIVQ